MYAHEPSPKQWELLVTDLSGASCVDRPVQDEPSDSKRGSGSYKPLPYEKDSVYSSENIPVNAGVENGYARYDLGVPVSCAPSPLTH